MLARRHLQDHHHDLQSGDRSEREQSIKNFIFITFLMKILVLNCGSSSVKYKLIDTDTDATLAEGGVEKIGLPDGFLKYKDFKKRLQRDNRTRPH